MDSGLLNAFHDDPFDGNYRKYDPETDFWSSEGETMGLAETLHGILPISATEDAAQLYTNTLLKDELQIESTSELLQSTKQSRNAFACKNYVEQQTVHNSGKMIDIIKKESYEANDFNLNNDGYNKYDDNDMHNDDLKDNDVISMDFDGLSESSNQTFRTRTDSSSIGDYESHSSDYDDDDNDEDNFESDINKFMIGGSALAELNKVEAGDILNNLSNEGLLAPEDFMLENNFKFPITSNAGSKNRTISVNTNNSEVDALGLQIDTNNFDLAEFITKDDFTENILAINKKPNIEQINSSIQNKSVESDTESDIIIDVETVELEDEINVKKTLLASASQTNTEKDEYDITYVDNIKRDPSWCPSASKKSEQHTKLTNTNNTNTVIANGHTNLNRNYPIVPNKKQCEILKRKFGSGRGGKNLMAQRNAKLAAKKAQEQQQQHQENDVIQVNEVVLEKVEKKPLGLGNGGKNLSLLKKECLSISEHSSEENSSPLKYVKAESVNQTKVKQELPETSPKAVKRKLNLEEYKQRRGDVNDMLFNVGANIKLEKPTQTKSTGNSNDNRTLQKIHANNTTQHLKHTASSKQSEAVKTIVQNLKAQTTIIQKTQSDPITEAKNKVLRMQELKKAQQIKILDSAVSAKVPRVTKLLPLKEIVKDTYPISDDVNVNLKGHLDYEEIIVVSASCNTDITIPPIRPVNDNSRSLLKSSVKFNITTSSLIASIQHEVDKKTQETNTTAFTTVIPSKKQQHSCEENPHGEDKIIMHLRKGRIRQRNFSAATQTDLLPEFPILPFPKAVITHKSRERKRHKASERQYRKRNAETTNELNSSFCSSDSDSSTTRARTRSRSPADYASSLERLRAAETNIANGGYSSRSSRRHRSSVSSSYSENERVARNRQRTRRYSFKKSKGYHESRSSSTSSMSDYSAKSRSRSRTRSRSPLRRHSRSRSRSHSNRSNYNNNRNSYVDRNVSQPAVEERRIVYVGRIEQETTKEILRHKFLAYGHIKQVTIHFKDTGMKYGFVTYERSQDAFAAIDNSTRDPQISMYDVSFGGRRAFCRASYADLDNAGINTYQSFVFPQAAPTPKEEDSFEALLLKVKAKLDANKIKPNGCTNETKNQI